MPGADFFRRLGLYVRPEFMDRAACARIRARMADAETSPGGIYGHADGLDLTKRRTLVVDVEDESPAVNARVLALTPDLSRHFGVTVDRCEGADFLRYPAGAFYRPHRDRGEVHGAERRISVVLFLNAPGRAPDGFAGGALRFYGLLGNDDRLGPLGVDLVPDAGLLVAFRSDVAHEVVEVTDGVRDVVVTWFS